MQLLIDASADVNATDMVNRGTPVHACALQEEAEVLACYNADPDSPTDIGQTPITTMSRRTFEKSDAKPLRHLWEAYHANTLDNTLDASEDDVPVVSAGPGR